MKRSVIALALVAALPFAASAADGLSYNNVQAGYVATNTDVGDTKGWSVGGSVAVHQNVHLFGSYANHDIEHTSFDFDQWQLGVGFNKSFSPKADFVATVAYDKVDLGGGVDADGYSAEAGVRGLLAPKFEGYAMLGYADAKDVSGEAYGRLGTTVHFNQTWGVNADVRFKDGDTQWFVGPRITW